MKKILLVAFILSQIITRSIASGVAQNKTFVICDKIAVNGTLVSGVGADSTMAGASNLNVVCALAIKQYVDSADKLLRANLTILNNDTAANHLNLIKFYNRSGLVSHQMKVWADTVTPSTANGYSVNITSAGFTTILSVQATVFQNSSTAATIPLISGKTFTTSAIITNVQTSNSGVLGILTGLIFATSLTGMTIHVVVVGY